MNRTELAHCPRKGEIFRIEIDRLSPKGFGVADYPAVVGPQKQSRDLKFYIRKAVPGDVVKVLTEYREGDRIEGHIREWLEYANDRIEPRCRHFGRRHKSKRGCGGCTFQAIPYHRELEFKESKVRKALHKEGFDVQVRSIVPHSPPWYYRNHMNFSFGDTANREFALGLYPTGYHHEILNLEECYLQSEFVSHFIPAVRQWAAKNGLEPYIQSDNEGFLCGMTIREGENTGQRLINLVTTWDSTAALNGEVVDVERIVERFQHFVEDEIKAPVTSIFWTRRRKAPGKSTKHIQHHVSGSKHLEEQLDIQGHLFRFKIPPRGFFQTNTKQAEVLYLNVLDATETTSGSIETALDLYCGTGTIGQILSTRFNRVIGIELQKDSVKLARENAKLNGLQNCEFYAGRIREKLNDVELSYRPDLVVVDPPRGGLQSKAQKTVGDLHAPRIIYVSCNPESFAEDLSYLATRGYKPEYIQPIDMFPQTYHVELVAPLVRKNRS